MPDKQERTPNVWTIPSSTAPVGASWLLHEGIRTELANGLQFRLAVPRGKGATASAWTVSHAANNTQPPLQDEVTVKVINRRGRDTIENHKASQLVTVHPLSTDVGKPVMLLNADQGIRIGILTNFDINGIFTKGMAAKYSRGSRDAIQTLKDAKCIVTSDGVSFTVPNRHIVPCRYNFSSK